MKSRLLAAAVPGLVSLWLSCPAWALDGEPFIHDPSTIMECDGKFYTFGTGSGGLVSEDGWTWHRGGVRPGGGAAPDAIRIGDRYLVAYGATGGGLGGGHNGRILTMWNKTLDPNSPDFQYSEAVVVASSDGVEDCDAIDPALLLDPTDGRLWLTYGTYFGYIRLVELDPKTGTRVPGNKSLDIAIDCEATALVYRDGWYYLLGTHGTCCNGTTSTYNIRVGRSRKVTGPYLDNMGMDMLRGGGKLVVAANGRLIGPGHFGLLDLGDGVQKFSCHYEADLDRGGRSVLDIRALLWKNGWPVAGDNFKGGTFEIESERSGYALELGVEPVFLGGGMGMRMGMGMGRGTRGGMPGAADANAAGARRGPMAGRGGAGSRRGGGMFGGGGGPTTPIAGQDVNDVAKNWPAGILGVRIGDYMLLAHQKWTITPVPNAGGTPGSPYFKITIAGTDRTLAVTDDAEVVAVPAFTGQLEQLWRIDQLTDGTYRILPKAASGSRAPLALTAVGASTPSLAPFDAKSDKARWNLKAL
ncbi:MAG: family 43 glycosylhydrolase [Phycisphaerae bacterium]|nr:family 43 glycosylhydrolase [Phycisphaerae bacterium]